MIFSPFLKSIQFISLFVNSFTSLSLFKILVSTFKVVGYLLRTSKTVSLRSYHAFISFSIDVGWIYPLKQSSRLSNSYSVGATPFFYSMSINLKSACVRADYFILWRSSRSPSYVMNRQKPKKLFVFWSFKVAFNWNIYVILDDSIILILNLNNGQLLYYIYIITGISSC